MDRVVDDIIQRHLRELRTLGLEVQITSVSA
jgi:hypothetical protein